MAEIPTPAALAQLAGPQAAAAWNVLVERFGVEVWRLMASRARAVHEAEDAYQEFWMALPHNALRFRPTGPDTERAARAWLLRIAYVTAASRRRLGIPRGVTLHPLHQDDTMDAHADQPLHAQPAGSPASAQDDDQAERNRLLERVHVVIGDLPERYRRPLLLHVVAGLSYEELAADLRCTVNHARVKVHRGLKRVRDLLGAEGATMPERALMGLFVPLLPGVPLAPPVAATAGLALQKAVGLGGRSAGRGVGSGGGQATLTLKAALTAACLAAVVAAVIAGTPIAVARPGAPAPIAAAPAPPMAIAAAAPLDGLPASSAAYGLRRLRSAYAGPALRVRAGSRQRDLAFTADGGLDLAALRAFCGAGDGFVVRWYDQSGNGIDLAQAVPARQPRLVAHGQVDCINQRPALHIAGAEQWLDASAVTTVGAVTALLSADQGGLYPEWKVVLASNTTYDRRYFRGEIDHATFDAVGAGPSTFYVDGRRTADGAPLDDGKVVTADLPRPLARESLRLGNDLLQTDLRGWGGFVAELVVFPRPLARDQRQALTSAGRAWLAGEVTAAR